MKMRLIKSVTAFAAFCLLISVIFAGCGHRRDPAGETLGTTVSAHYDVLQERQRKDAFFRSASSPLPVPEREKFKGLSYYAINPEMIFQVRLERYSTPRTIRMATNTGEIRGGIIYGFFEFTAKNQTCRVQVYRLEEAFGKPALFIPFLG